MSFIKEDVTDTIKNNFIKIFKNELLEEIKKPENFEKMKKYKEQGVDLIKATQDSLIHVFSSKDLGDKIKKDGD